MSDIREALESAFNEEDGASNSQASVELLTGKEDHAPDAVDYSKETARSSCEIDNINSHEHVENKEPAYEKKAPSSWKKEAQEAFLKADRGEPLTNDEIKILTKEAERREADFHRGISEFQGHSQRARQYDQAFAPYQDYLKSLNIDAPTAVGVLMRADMTLRTGDPATKSNYFRQLAKEYGIDIGTLGEQAKLDPQTEYLMGQLNSLRNQQQMWQNQIHQQEQERVNSEISRFATEDKKHFEAVRNDMADLLESGSAKDLQDAYNKAIWMRPEIRQTLIEQERQDAQRKAAQDLQSQRAKTAVVSVKGSSPISAGSETIRGSLRDILSSQFDDKF